MRWAVCSFLNAASFVAIFSRITAFTALIILAFASLWVAAIPASSISILQSGNISSTDVQSALQELDSEKQPSGTYSTDIHSNITALNAVSGTNTGDETLTTIKTKLGAVTSASDGYVKYQDWNMKANTSSIIPQGNIVNYSVAENSDSFTGATSYSAFPILLQLLDNTQILFYKQATGHVGNDGVAAKKISY